MTKLPEKIAVMQAYEKGEKIEHRRPPSLNWYDESVPQWDWVMYEYHVKCGQREVWINEYCDGIGDYHYPTEVKAAAESSISPRIRCIHFVEKVD